MEVQRLADRKFPPNPFMVTSDWMGGGKGAKNRHHKGACGRVIDVICHMFGFVVTAAVLAHIVAGIVLMVMDGNGQPVVTGTPMPWKLAYILLVLGCGLSIVPIIYCCWVAKFDHALFGCIRLGSSQGDIEYRVFEKYGQIENVASDPVWAKSAASSDTEARYVKNDVTSATMATVSGGNNFGFSADADDTLDDNYLMNPRPTYMPVPAPGDVTTIPFDDVSGRKSIGVERTTSAGPVEIASALPEVYVPSGQRQNMYTVHIGEKVKVNVPHPDTDLPVPSAQQSVYAIDIGGAKDKVEPRVNLRTDNYMYPDYGLNTGGAAGTAGMRVDLRTDEYRDHGTTLGGAADRFEPKVNLRNHVTNNHGVTTGGAAKRGATKHDLRNEVRQSQGINIGGANTDNAIHTLSMPNDPSKDHGISIRIGNGMREQEPVHSGRNDESSLYIRSVKHWQEKTLDLGHEDAESDVNDYVPAVRPRTGPEVMSNPTYRQQRQVMFEPSKVEPEAGGHVTFTSVTHHPSDVHHNVTNHHVHDHHVHDAGSYSVNHQGAANYPAHGTRPVGTEDKPKYNVRIDTGYDSDDTHYNTNARKMRRQTFASTQTTFPGYDTSENLLRPAPNQPPGGALMVETHLEDLGPFGTKRLYPQLFDSMGRPVLNYPLTPPLPYNPRFYEYQSIPRTSPYLFKAVQDIETPYREVPVLLEPAAAAPAVVTHVPGYYGDAGMNAVVNPLFDPQYGDLDHYPVGQPAYGHTQASSAGERQPTWRRRSSTRDPYADSNPTYRQHRPSMHHLPGQPAQIVHPAAAGGTKTSAPQPSPPPPPPPVGVVSVSSRDAAEITDSQHKIEQAIKQQSVRGHMLQELIERTTPTRNALNAYQ